DEDGRVAADSGTESTRGGQCLGRFGGDRGGGDAHGPTSVADAGIEEGIGDVDRQIDEDVDQREQQDHPLDDGIVALQHRVDDEPAEAGDVEDGLGDDHTADQGSDADADYSHDRHGGILERMQQEHAIGGE